MLMPDSCWSLTFTSPMLSSYHLHWGNLVLWLKLSGEESLSLWNAHLSKVCSCQVSTAPRDCISKTCANIVSFHMHELESDHLHHHSAMSDHHHHQQSRTLKLMRNLDSVCVILLLIQNPELVWSLWLSACLLPCCLAMLIESMKTTLFSKTSNHILCTPHLKIIYNSISCLIMFIMSFVTQHQAAIFKSSQVKLLSLQIQTQL